MVLKGCPKCRGDLSLDHELQDRTLDLVCIQCGYRLPSSEREALLTRPQDRAVAGATRMAERQRTAA
ncbi:MAG: hypothetical protein AB7R89_07030 [Dehalococcoidia bacterium]